MTEITNTNIEISNLTLDHLQGETILENEKLPPDYIVQLCQSLMPDICTIGESVKVFEDDVHFISEAIAHELDHSPYFDNALMETLKSIVFEQPHKQPAISLIILVVNSKNAIAGKKIFDHCMNEFQKWLTECTNENFNTVANDTGPWNRVKLLLRLIALLSPMICSEELISIFKSFFEIVVKLDKCTPNKRNPLVEMLYTNTILNIPFLLFFDRENSDIDNGIQELLAYIENNYQPLPNTVEITDEFSVRNGVPRIEYCQVILDNVKNILSDNRKALYGLFPNYMKLFPAQLKRLTSNIPLRYPSISQLLSLTESNVYLGSVSSTWKSPKFNFQIFSPDNICKHETVIPFTTYEGFLFKDITTDIVQSMEFNLNEVARQVFTLDMFLQKNIFMAPGTTYNELEQQLSHDSTISSYKLEDIVVETILNAIFNLPIVSQSYGYYFNLLVKICKDSSKSIAPVYGRAVRFFYNKLDYLDFELTLRFLNWFSFQISNFNFTWKWSEWGSEFNRVKFIPYHPKNIFIRNLIKKELRLTSNKVDIEDSLTAEFKDCLYDGCFSEEYVSEFYSSLFLNIKFSKVQSSPMNFFFVNNNIPMLDSVNEIIDYMHQDSEKKEIVCLELILERLKSNFGSIIPNLDKFIVILLIQCLLYSGRRSLSHTNKYISDYLPDIKFVFKKLQSDKNDIEKWVVESILVFWNSNSQTGFLIIDGLRHCDFISSKNVVQFCYENNDGKILAICDSTATEAILRILKEVTPREQDNFNVFLCIFRMLCESIEESSNSRKGIKLRGSLNPSEEINKDIENIYWKYSMSLRCLKTMLRMFYKNFFVLESSLRYIVKEVITVSDVKNIIDKYISDLSLL